MKHSEVTSGRRELGEELIRLRREHKRSGNEVALRLGWSPSRVSRLENGLTGITDGHLAALLADFEVEEEVFVQLFELNRVALDHSRIRPHRELLVDQECLVAVHAATAMRVTEYEPLTIPTLLQTTEYARALASTTELIADEAVEQQRQAREHCQAILTRAQPTVRFFIGEQVLRAPTGDKPLMSAQLRHLITTAARHECTIRVLPASACPGGAFGGAFRLLEYTDSRDVVCTQNHTALIFQENPAEVAAYRAIVNRLHHLALDKEQSMQVINDLAITYTGIIEPLTDTSTNGID